MYFHQIEGVEFTYDSHGQTFLSTLYVHTYTGAHVQITIVIPTKLPRDLYRKNWPIRYKLEIPAATDPQILHRDPSIFLAFADCIGQSQRKTKSSAFNFIINETRAGHLNPVFRQYTETITKITHEPFYPYISINFYRPTSVNLLFFVSHGNL